MLVPLPIGNGEQRLNAADLVAAGGALLVEDADFTADYLADTLLPLLQDPRRWPRWALPPRRRARADAAAGHGGDDPRIAGPRSTAAQHETGS